MGEKPEADNTATEQPSHGAEHLAEHQFKPGQSGNPKGRPKGARNQLSEAFLKDAIEAWKLNGKTALASMASDKPGDFAKMVAGLVPKEMEITGEVEHNINPIQALMNAVDGKTRTK